MSAELHMFLGTLAGNYHRPYLSLLSSFPSHSSSPTSSSFSSSFYYCFSFLSFSASSTSLLLSQPSSDLLDSQYIANQLLFNGSYQENAHLLSQLFFVSKRKEVARRWLDGRYADDGGSNPSLTWDFQSSSSDLRLLTCCLINPE